MKLLKGGGSTCAAVGETECTYASVIPTDSFVGRGGAREPASSNRHP